MMDFENKDEKLEHKRILMSHHLFGGFRLAGSEQSVTISGLDGLPSSMWGLPYDDLVLGHIHQTQMLRETEPRAIYPGSPLRFRFNEKREKKVSIISWDDNGYRQEYMPIPEFRPVISVKLTQEQFKDELKQALEKETSHPELAGLLEVKLTVQGAPVGMADQIRECLTTIKSKWELLSLQIEGSSKALDSEDKKRAHVISNFSGGAENMEELFKLFYKKRYPDNEKVPETLLEDFKALVQELDKS